ncbi:kinase-like domain-containing protein [Nemania abortiva]|nr:kinase-like domain-containing protein [Nemania abortiva]
MKIHDTGQIFKADNGRIKFIYTQVIFSQDGKIFSGHSPDMNPEANLRIEDLEDCYVKQPNLSSLEVSPGIANPVLQELAVCELIKQHPHPNIATYYGCRSTNGRVIGLCFERYSFNLGEKLNPGHLNKSAFIDLSDRAVTSGIRHLHSLGPVHNDLNPSNIMIAEDGRPVIIDFDSCRAIGADLKTVKRTYEWYDRDVNISVETDDLHALEEIRVWLAGSTPAGYRFER